MEIRRSGRKSQPSERVLALVCSNSRQAATLTRLAMRDAPESGSYLTAALSFAKDSDRLQLVAVVPQVLGYLLQLDFNRPEVDGTEWPWGSWGWAMGSGAMDAE